MNPENQFKILGDQPKKGDLDAILAKGEAYLKRQELEEKKSQLESRRGRKPESNPRYLPGNLTSKLFQGSFDLSKEALENEGYEIISLEQMAELRIQEGKDSEVSTNGDWTREGFIYVPKKGIYLTKNSPIMENSKEATECHRNDKDFYPTSKQIENALADSCKVTNEAIPTLKLADEELTAYAFGKQAKAYGEFLKEAGIDTLKVYTADMQDKPFATQVWLGRLVIGYYSVLNGVIRYCDRNLACDGRSRGVQKATGEAGSQKIGGIK